MAGLINQNNERERERESMHDIVVIVEKMDGPKLQVTVSLTNKWARFRHVLFDVRRRI